MCFGKCVLANGYMSSAKSIECGIADFADDHHCDVPIQE